MRVSSYIKVIGYRQYETRQKSWETKQVFFDLPYEFKTHQEMFDGIEGFLATLDPNETYNLHYTLNHIPEGAKSKKSFYKYEVIPFDIDLIDIDKKELYIKSVEKVLQINRSEMVVVSSGHGLHFLITLQQPLKNIDDIKELRDSYDALCDKIEAEFIQKNLIVDIGDKKTHCDKAVFRLGTLRLPGTKNIKYNEKTGNIVDTTSCELITRIMVPKTLSQIGLQKSEETIRKFDPDKYWSKTDSKYIFENCGALKEFKEKKGNVSRGAWFSSLSVISRLNDIDGVSTAHELSKGDPRYTFEETQKLIDSTLQEGGPHKCTTFKRSFDACKTCKLKCTTPLQLRSKSHLKYEEKGFHVFRDTSWAPYFKEMIIKVGQDNNYKVKGSNQELWRYNDTEYKWEPWERHDFRAYATNLMLNKPGDVAKTITKNELENQLLDRNPLPDNYFLDISKNKINFQNGILYLDKKTSEGFRFKLHEPSDYKEGFLYCLPFSYDEKAEAPKFKEFISDICLERKDLENLLYEYLGYTLSNDEIWEHKALLLKGEGANGKSVLLEVIKSLIGDTAYSILNMKQLQDHESRAKLIGSIANISDESPKDSLFEAEDFKNLVSGGEFEYRVLYKGKGYARNRAKFIFSTNYDLHVTDRSSAVARRLFIAPMDANFDPALGAVTKPPNPNIIEDLKKELPGIFNICFTKYMKAKKAGAFSKSITSAKKVEEMFEDSNPVHLYLQECINMNVLNDVVVNPSYEFLAEYVENYVREIPVAGKDVTENEDMIFVTNNVIRTDFQLWAEDNGYKSKFTTIRFGQEIARAFKKYVGIHKWNLMLMRKNVNGKKMRGYMCPWTPYADQL